MRTAPAGAAQPQFLSLFRRAMHRVSPCLTQWLKPLPMSALTLMPALATATATAPAPLPSQCPRVALVDDTLRDAALSTLNGLLIRAPGQAADGAVVRHASSGHVDPQGRGWRHIAPYEANLGLLGALSVDARLLEPVGRWLRWQARLQGSRGAARGVLLEHWVRDGDLRLSTCPAGIEPRHCDHVDASDSTIASGFLLAQAYLRHGGDPALLREPAVHRSMLRAADALQRLTTPEGLSWARQDHREAYLMDAVEVRAGWLAWAAIQEQVHRDPVGARHSRAQADTTAAAMERRLWLPEVGLWRVSLGAGPPRLTRWYADTIAQAWPLLWSPPGTATAAHAANASSPPDPLKAAWRRASAAWQGPDGRWALLTIDPDGFHWPSVAVAAACIGQTAEARAWLDRLRPLWLPPEGPAFAWPFQVSDLLWLFWLANPIESSPPPATQPRALARPAPVDPPA